MRILLVLVVFISGCAGNPYLYQVGVTPSYSKRTGDASSINHRGDLTEVDNSGENWGISTSFLFRFKDGE